MIYYLFSGMSVLWDVPYWICKLGPGEYVTDEPVCIVRVTLKKK